MRLPGASPAASVLTAISQSTAGNLAASSRAGARVASIESRVSRAEGIVMAMTLSPGRAKSRALASASSESAEPSMHARMLTGSVVVRGAVCFTTRARAVQVSET
eukprot:Amastigsp_a676257_860.p3 type:complete len:105 gc:universal Amastigsp_a676257_860:804-490(-)